MCFARKGANVGLGHDMGRGVVGCGLAKNKEGVSDGI